MSNFEETWKRVTATRHSEQVAPQLRPLLKQAHEQITKQPLDLLEIKAALADLLLFLSTEGRTSANCVATDLFFNLVDWNNVDWEALPEPLAEVIGDIGGALHDTVDYPEIAEMFGGLPEHLLKRLEEWDPTSWEGGSQAK